ncbi:hypothetical protein J2858_002542 [Neorhizobium galegae]|uniref:AsmA-like C-terminal region-containing protein n=1 Tax=Neorhizobium galegae TaxID=399 RepID=UPI001AE61ACF|nr:AsmA-like C-terminal region-containing protein [Neorhizobium galegae]MBP2549619.1 hypothetical protein [Neorhizobium galegae]
MAEIRGEKVSFGRKDMVALHELPSAQVHDPLIVHCPRDRSRAQGILRFCLLFLALCAGAVISGFFAIETGTIDGALNARAQSALSNAIGNRYSATVGSTAIRFDHDFRLALEARDVDIVEVATGEHLTRTAAIRLAIDPVALLSGRVSIRRMEADNISLDTALLPAGDPMDLSKTRVDRLPAALEQAFQRLDEARGIIERTGTALVRINGINIQFPPNREGKVSTLVIDDLKLALTQEGMVGLTGILELDGRRANLNVQATAVNGVTRQLTAHVAGLDMTPFLLQRMPDGEPREGLQGAIDLDLKATRDTQENEPSIEASIHHAPGFFYFDGVGQELSGAEVHTAYDFARNTIEIRPSKFRFGPTVLPLTGAIVDLDRLNTAETRPGFGISMLISGGHAQAANGGEQPVLFDLNTTGRYFSADHVLEFDDMQVSSPAGQMAGALKVHFPGVVSPEISFGAQLPRMDVAGVKQLWPFWMARKARDWAVANMFGGTVTNGSISVFIPAGRMHGPGIPLQLDSNELRIAFDIADTRLTLPGDLAPVRDLGGHVEVQGARVDVGVRKAASYFPSGRQVVVDEGRFVIESTYRQPLMADLSLNVTGSADALAELASFKPIDGLKNLSFKPDDFKGDAEAAVTARFGLVASQNPPKPAFSAKIDLQGVDVGQPIAGRKIGNLEGDLDIDGSAARLSAKGTIDTVPAQIKLVEPIGKTSEVARDLLVTTTLSNEQRDKLAPGLSDIVSGPVGVEVKRIDDDRQSVKLDLAAAVLSVPGIGWSKGSGIPATATFELSEKDGSADIHKLDVSGDGFGVRGDLKMGTGGLVSGDFSQVQLSPADDLAVSVRRSKGLYDISASGKAADLRPVLQQMRAQGGSGPGGGGDKASSSVRVRAKLDRVIGFNDESLGNVDFSLTLRASKLRQVDLNAVTGSGQAVVAQTAAGAGEGGETITLTSGDAGALVRFANLYDHMRGGLLNIRLNNEAAGDMSGSVDIRSFSLVNENRLQSIVSTPVGEDGRSLNAAVKRDIDVSSEKFQRAFARLVYRGGALSVENGVVRGEQIGATFQGMLRDAAGRMDMTGTFMPAYGLNRLFAELPIIGAILGNGRDRGLLGITFKVAGRFDQPKLTVNPLSIIAPGVFRQIFEFQ